MQSNTKQLEFPELAEYDELNKRITILHDVVTNLAKFHGVEVKQIDVGVWEVRVIRETT